jgi:hypothetical protein
MAVLRSHKNEAVLRKAHEKTSCWWFSSKSRRGSWITSGFLCGFFRAEYAGNFRKSSHSSGPSVQSKLRRPVTCLDETRILYFFDVFIILRPLHRVEGQFGVLILDFGLYCKNSLPNAADVEEDYILLSLGSHSKQGSDEYHLTPDISFLHPLYLPLPHHIHRFVSLQRSPCRFIQRKCQYSEHDRESPLKVGKPLPK